MPIIKSAKKRMRQTAVRKARNQQTKKSLRAELKAFNAAVAAKDGKKAASLLGKVQSKLDVAVKKNVMEKNTAARKLSALSSQVKELGAKPAAGEKKKTAPKKATPKKAATKPTTKTTAKSPAKKTTAAKKTATKK